jgi:tetratricopeptide (TPR) repeat protein
VADGRHDRALAVPEPEPGPARTAWRLERLSTLLEAPHLPPETARRAVVELENAFETEGPWLPSVRLTRAVRLQTEDRPVEALALVRELIEQNPDQQRYHLVEALLLGDLDPDGFLAQAAFEALAARWSEQSGAHFQLAVHRLEQRDWAGAWEATRAALATAGNERSVLDLAVELAQQDPLAAHQMKAHLENWSAAEPGNQLPLDLLARFATRLGDDEAMLTRLRERQALAHHDHAYYHLELGDALARLGRLTPAHDHWNAAVTFVPAARRVWTSLDLTGQADHAETFFAEFGPDVEAAIAGA